MFKSLFSFFSTPKPISEQPNPEEDMSRRGRDATSSSEDEIYHAVKNIMIGIVGQAGLWRGIHFSENKAHENTMHNLIVVDFNDVLTHSDPMDQKATIEKNYDILLVMFTDQTKANRLKDRFIPTLTAGRSTKPIVMYVGFANSQSSELEEALNPNEEALLKIQAPSLTDENMPEILDLIFDKYYEKLNAEISRSLFHPSH